MLVSKIKMGNTGLLLFSAWYKPALSVNLKSLLNQNILMGVLAIVQWIDYLFKQPGGKLIGIGFITELTYPSNTIEGIGKKNFSGGLQVFGGAYFFLYRIAGLG